MATIASDSKLHRTLRFYEASAGKKVVMASTGLVLFGYVIIHLLGNLQVYTGPGALDAYGKKLREFPAVLWGARAVLLACVGAHIAAAFQLWRLKQQARPQPYVKKVPTVSTYASRTMYWSGPILLAFIIYHILHFTTGTVLPGYVEGAVHANLVRGFQNPLSSAFYILAMSMLCLHLYHGVWSMFHSIGFSHPKYSPKLKTFAAGIAVVIAAGNISIPVSVLLGIIK